MGLIGRIINKVAGRSSAAPTKTIGVGGSVVDSGYLRTGEKNADLIGQKKYLTYSNMLANTAVIATGVRFFLALVSKVEWRFPPVDESQAAQDASDFVESMLDDMTTPMHRVVRRGAMYRFQGFSIQEITAKLRDDGRIGIKDIESRPQATIKRWDQDESGTVLGMWQEHPRTYEEIYLPRLKCMYLVDDALDDTPEGVGIFRHLAKLTQGLQRLEQLEGFGYETDLHGVPVARAPFSELKKLEDEGVLSKTDRMKIEKPLRDFIDQHQRNPGLGVYLDSAVHRSTGADGDKLTNTYMWDVDLLKSAQAASQQAVAEAIERKQREIARLLGIEHLLLGSGAKGSFAMSRDKTRNFALLVDGTLKELRTQFRKDVLEFIWQLNGLDPDIMPKPETEAVQHRAIEEITGALADLAQAGADPLDIDTVNAVRKLLGLPDAVPLDELDMDLSGADPLPGNIGRDKPKGDAKTTPTVGEKEEGNES